MIAFSELLATQLDDMLGNKVVDLLGSDSRLYELRNLTVAISNDLIRLFHLLNFSGRFKYNHLIHSSI
ncbi:hypothetical protein D3C73_1058990 [compost metagenome]